MKEEILFKLNENSNEIFEILEEMKKNIEIIENSLKSMKKIMEEEIL